MYITYVDSKIINGAVKDGFLFEPSVHEDLVLVAETLSEAT